MSEQDEDQFAEIRAMFETLSRCSEVGIFAYHRWGGISGQEVPSWVGMAISNSLDPTQRVLFLLPNDNLYPNSDRLNQRVSALTLHINLTNPQQREQLFLTALAIQVYRLRHRDCQVDNMTLAACAYSYWNREPDPGLSEDLQKAMVELIQELRPLVVKRKEPPS